jgi:hypothetical protein
MKPTLSWFSLDVSLEEGVEPIFKGYFSTDSNTNVINGFYETINGKTNFDKNLLFASGTETDITYEGFTVYSIQNNSYYYDNGYVNTWKQFDWFGVIISKMSYYSDNTHINLCAQIVGDETSTNVGNIVLLSSDNQDIFISAIFTLTPVADPTVVPSWFSIDVSFEAGLAPIFTGYFSTDSNTNVVNSFYETINGKTNFNENLLVTSGTKTEITYDGLTVYALNDMTYDNGYVNTWKQFDWFGVMISKMSYYSDNTNINFCAQNIGNETSTNVGYIVTDFNTVFVSATFTIIPISDPTCFNEGTKILCLNKNLEEEYIPIETLKKGDLVKSYKHGYRKIDLIGKNTLVNNPSKFNECMYKMEKTEENGLLEDLIVTGGHAILVDELGEHKQENDKIFGETPKIDGKYLLLSCVSKNFTKIEETTSYTYYHLTLENNGDDEERFGIWANGVLTETPSKKIFSVKQLNLL